MRPALALIGLLLLSYGTQAQDRTAAELQAEAQAQLDAFPYKSTREASIYRGTIVFMNRCVNCHGVNADGISRAANIYNPKPSNLRVSMKSDAYKQMIIRRGGKVMARSEFMPPWGEALTEEELADVVNYLRTIAPPDAPK